MSAPKASEPILACPSTCTCRYCQAAERHGITRLRLAEMRTEQNDCCAVCQVYLPVAESGFQVDHDHRCCDKTGCSVCVRGLLCVNCNVGLGRLGDSVTGLLRALVYLQAWEDRNRNVLVDKIARKKADVRVRNGIPDVLSIFKEGLSV